MMSASVVATSRAIDDVFALVALITNPKDAAAALKKIADAQDTLGRRALELAARDKALAEQEGTMRMAIAESERRRVDLDGREKGIADAERSIEAEKAAIAEKADEITQRGQGQSKDAARHAQAVAQWTASVRDREEDLLMSSRAQSTRAADLDKREDDVASRERAVQEKLAKIAEAVR